MKFNLRKISGMPLGAEDDKVQKSKQHNQWSNRFIGLVEKDSFEALSAFIKNNSYLPDFDYFLMSMISRVQSMYSGDTYEIVLNIIKQSNPSLEAKISEDVE
jgi:hypothetical protein